jgi:hypothetical protein
MGGMGTDQRPFVSSEVAIPIGVQVRRDLANICTVILNLFQDPSRRHAPFVFGEKWMLKQAQHDV